METSSTSKSFMEKLIDGLRATATELEELRVQLALGKAEASLKFAQFNRELKESIEKGKIWLNDESNEMKAVFEELRLQLALGKAEFRDDFHEQKRKVDALILEAKEIAKKTGSQIFSDEKLGPQIDKFKLRMEVLKLRFEAAKQDLKEDTAEFRQELKKNLQVIEQELSEDIKQGRKELKEAAEEAYAKLKGLFVRD